MVILTKVLHPAVVKSTTRLVKLRGVNRISPTGGLDFLTGGLNSLTGGGGWAVSPRPRLATPLVKLNPNVVILTKSLFLCFQRLRRT